MEHERIPFALPDITEAEIDAVARTIRSGWVTSGPEMRLFESEFATKIGGGVESVAVSSATAGLHLVLEALGIGPGDEVIVPSWTFTATAAAVSHTGARPVLVDIDPWTLNMDLERVSESLSSATRAVIPVHLAGLGMNTKEIRDVVGPDVRIVEDAAHALPTVTSGLRVGQCEHSDAAVFSFYATKTMTTGEGGMITTRDAVIAERSRILRLHGIDRDAFNRYRSNQPAWFYDVVAEGYKYNMPDPAAAMGRVQLRRSSTMHRRRSDLAARYKEELADLPLQMPADPPVGDTHAWHLFIARTTGETPLHRDDLIQQLADRGIGTSVHFVPLHMHSVWRSTLHTTPGQYPVATREFARVISLPLFSSLSDDSFARIVTAVRETLQR